MARSSTKRTSQFGILMVIGVIVVAYLVYAFTVGPLRPEASEVNTVGGSVTEPQPFLIRSGNVSSFSDNTLSVDESELGSFTVKLADSSVVRAVNDNGLFEIVDRTELSKGDVVIVYYSQGMSELQIESVDIIENK